MIFKYKENLALILFYANIFAYNIKDLHAQNRYNTYNVPKSSYVKGFGYGSGYDSRYFKHGSSKNERNGGTCSEFLNINSLNQCCSSRDDDCYMIHFDTRCYCDVFCDRSKVPDNSDCCPDAEETCIGKQITSPPVQDCFKNGNSYRSGERFKDNCNECYCENGRLDCTNKQCLINLNLMSEINEQGSTWTAGNHSAFWGKTLEHGYKHRLGTQLPNRVQRDYTNEANEKPIKDSYDFRNEPYIQNSQRKNSIRDQGDCAASWAFSTVDVATDRTAKVHEGKKGNESASVQMLISCAILPRNANGCSPAPVDVAWKFIENSNKDPEGKIVGGLVSEKCYPYESGETGYAPECKVNSNSNRLICPSDNRAFTKPLLNSAPAYPLKAETANDLMEEIYKNGPVQVVFKVFEDFFMYRGGIYSKHPSAKIGNEKEPWHSVKVLGWGSENGVDYWIGANSWGESWGENGYFRIARKDDDETEFGHYAYGSWGSRPINTKNKNTNYNKRNRNIQRKE